MNAMKAYKSALKHALLLTLMLQVYGLTYSQPSSYSWNHRHNYIDYVSDAKDQGEQGPCGIFATVAAVEAMIEIYFNHEGSNENLSESNLYSDCTLHNWTPDLALPFFKSNGSVDEGTWPWPGPVYTKPDHPRYMTNPPCNTFLAEDYDHKAKIPGWGVSLWGSNPTIDSVEDLKKAIMDYGPIILAGNGADQSGNKLGRALHPGDSNVHHSILVTGWTANGKWEIKDSWPGAPASNRQVAINFFDYAPNCYWIKPVVNDNGTLKYITVKDYYGIDKYSRESAIDDDRDGFYRWGLEAYPTSGFTGYYPKMDFDDRDKYVIFCDGYTPVNGPRISDTTSKWVCAGGKTFTLDYFDPELTNRGFSTEWNVTPTTYFSSNCSGSGATTNLIVPITGYVGKKGKIEYKLKYNGNVLTTHKFEFYLIGPRENYVTVSILDSYGGSPQSSGDFYYLCPNTNYTISYINSDQDCTTSNFSWVLPSGWTTNYTYDNLISINTNNYPYGMVQISATTSKCGPNVILKDLYFAEGYCGEYFMAYPNPTDDFVNIDIIKEKFPIDEDPSSEQSILTIIDGSGIAKSKVNFTSYPYKLGTGNLPEGLYYLNIQYKDKKSTIRLSIKH